MLFANGLAANLETFSLILQEIQTNSFEGLTRTAADNTLQVTRRSRHPAATDEISRNPAPGSAQTFLGVYRRQSQLHRLLRRRTGKDDRDNGVSQRREQSKAAPCVVDARARSSSSCSCDGTVYLVSVVPIVRAQEANLGDATQGLRPAGCLAGSWAASPLANPAIIASLQNRRIENPLIWVGDNLIYPTAGKPQKALPPASEPMALHAEYRLDQHRLFRRSEEDLGRDVNAWSTGCSRRSRRCARRSQSSVLTVVGIGALHHHRHA